MIDITVKTLDSQNHHYSVPDDVSLSVDIVKLISKWLDAIFPGI